MATLKATGNNPLIKELINILGLKRVSGFSIYFKKDANVTVTATMNVEEDAVVGLTKLVKKYKLVEIE